MARTSELVHGWPAQRRARCGRGVLVATLDARLLVWRPELAAEVRQRIAEIIEAADRDALDLMRSRAAEQAVLDTLEDDLESHGRVRR